MEGMLAPLGPDDLRRSTTEHGGPNVPLGGARRWAEALVQNPTIRGVICMSCFKKYSQNQPGLLWDAELTACFQEICRKLGLEPLNDDKFQKFLNFHNFHREDGLDEHSFMQLFDKFLKCAVKGSAIPDPLRESLHAASFDDFEACWHRRIRVATGWHSDGSRAVSDHIVMVQQDEAGCVSVKVDGIADDVLNMWVANALQPLLIDSFGQDLVDWSASQLRSRGLTFDRSHLPRHLRDIAFGEAGDGLPHPADVKANETRPLKIYTWGQDHCSLDKTTGLPLGAQDSEAKYCVEQIQVRGGDADTKTMTGKDPPLQRNACKDALFHQVVRQIVHDVESRDLLIISVFCSAGHHRSVAAAELLKTIYYPNAVLDHKNCR
eukprot:gnl/TRDRNA2_/TRDRNA2_31426_c0_seq2.p1 gnl/TRDRNA2_/TRDRNA2_31426_c0~~gnl/TRDRNA2_/TRDRNA2_31426_c0_seq2.p1  ORF type:complete len:378 (-),score=47.59 gnl/TRDRNA2_/TRDRNA2_31426_c0_seq2:23-1156(-)